MTAIRSRTVAAAVIIAAAAFLSPRLTRADWVAEHREFVEDFLARGGINEAGSEKIVDGVRAARNAGATPSGPQVDPIWADAQQVYIDDIVIEIPLAPLRAFHAFSQMATGPTVAVTFADLLRQGVSAPMPQAYGLAPATMHRSATAPAASEHRDTACHRLATEVVDVLAARGMIAAAFKTAEMREIAAFPQTPLGEAFARRVLPAMQSVIGLIMADMPRVTGIDRQGVEQFLNLTHTTSTAHEAFPPAGSWP